MLKRLASQTATYGLTSILGRLMGNLLLPLQTHQLTLHDFSVLSEVLAYTAVLAVVFPLGLETALFRYSNEDVAQKQAVENKIISLQMMVTTALLPVAFAWLSFELPDVGPVDIFAICATVAADSIVGIFTTRLRNHSQSRRFFLVRFGSIMLMIALNLLFLSNIPWVDRFNPIGINYRLILYINLVAAVLTIGFLPQSIAAFRWSIDRPLFKKVLRFSVPILLMGIVGVSNDIFGRIWLERLTPSGFYGSVSNKDLIGIYAGCAKVAIFINLGIQAYRYAADPFFFSIQDKKDTANYLAKSFTWFVSAGLLALVAIECNIELIVSIFLRKPAFMLGLSSIFFLLLGNFFFGVYYNLSFWYKFTDKTYWGSLISILGLVTNAGLNFLLVPIFGMVGSAIALLCCAVFMCVVSFFKGRQYFAVPWAYSTVVVLFLTAITCCLIAIYVPASAASKAWLGVLLPFIFLAVVVWLQRQLLFNRFSFGGSR